MLLAFLLVVGVVFSERNIWIFISLRSYRLTSYRFYFLIGLINNLDQLLINLIYDILSEDFRLNLANCSIFLCKSRLFFTAILDLIYFSAACLSTIDQYLLTWQNVSLRRYSQIEWPHRIVIVRILILCIHDLIKIIKMNRLFFIRMYGWISILIDCNRVNFEIFLLRNCGK